MRDEFEGIYRPWIERQKEKFSCVVTYDGFEVTLSYTRYLNIVMSFVDPTPTSNLYLYQVKINIHNEEHIINYEKSDSSMVILNTLHDFIYTALNTITDFDFFYEDNYDICKEQS